MNKKAINPLSATILFIGFTILLASLVMYYADDLFRPKNNLPNQTIKEETKPTPLELYQQMVYKNSYIHEDNLSIRIIDGYLYKENNLTWGYQNAMGYLILNTHNGSISPNGNILITFFVNESLINKVEAYGENIASTYCRSSATSRIEYDTETKYCFKIQGGMNPNSTQEIQFVINKYRPEEIPTKVRIEIADGAYYLTHKKEGYLSCMKIHTKEYNLTYAQDICGKDIPENELQYGFENDILEDVGFKDKIINVSIGR